VSTPAFVQRRLDSSTASGLVLAVVSLVVPWTLYLTVPAGTLLASTPVDARAAFGTLDIAHKWIVYSAGRQIRIVGPLGGDRTPASSAHPSDGCVD